MNIPTEWRGTVDAEAGLRKSAARQAQIGEAVFSARGSPIVFTKHLSLPQNERRHGHKAQFGNTTFV